MTPRPVAALAILLAACQGPTAQASDALALDMKARLLRADPALAVTIEAPDRLLLRKNGRDSGMIDLANLREICAKAEAAVCEEQKQRRVAMQADVGALTGDGLVLSELRLVVRPASHQAAIQQQLAAMAQGKPEAERARILQGAPVLRPLGSRLVKGWVRDSVNGMAPLTPAQVKSSGLSANELDRIGAANLASERIEPLSTQSDYPGVFATVGNDYLPSVLVDEALWSRVAGEHARSEVSICLPARHELLVYVAALDPDGRVDFPAMCEAMAEQAAPTFSGQIVRRVDGRWLLD